MTADKRRFVISVLVADRVGILRDICSAVTDLGANIDGISQTVTSGYFTVILTVTLNRSTSAEAVRGAVTDAFPSGEASVIVRDFDARRAMRAAVHGDRYVVTAAGRDQHGILKTVTTYLAEKGINIEDWYFAIDGDAVTHVGEVTVPAILDIKQVQSEFQERMLSMGLSVGLQHENIFRVTHEVGAVRRLIVGRSHA